MPRPRNTLPRFCIDSTGRAFTKVDGTFVSLGRGDDPKSRQRYADVLTKVANGESLNPTSPPATTGKPKSISLNELLVKYITTELPRFSPAEQHRQKCAMKIARMMFGEIPVCDFGPMKLRQIRDAMVKGDPNAKPRPRKPWCRGFVNKQVKRLRAVWHDG